MNALSPDLKAQFPGLAGGWHYLDTGATAQKPQAVIDACVAAMGADYATVHRGVYARSAQMTLAFEAARAKVAGFIGGKSDELVFTRGATEAINLVANTWGAANLRAGDRVRLSLQYRLPEELNGVGGVPLSSASASSSSLAKKLSNASWKGSSLCCSWQRRLTLSRRCSSSSVIGIASLRLRFGTWRNRPMLVSC